jgi:hypothetical protein
MQEVYFFFLLAAARAGTLYTESAGRTTPQPERKEKFLNFARMSLVAKNKMSYNTFYQPSRSLVSD